MNWRLFTNVVIASGWVFILQFDSTPTTVFLAWGGIIALIASSYLLGSKDATKGENNGSD